MSCMPDPHEKCDSAEKVHSVGMTEPMPILASQNAKATERDKELAKVLTAVRHATSHLLHITAEELMVALLGADE